MNSLYGILTEDIQRKIEFGPHELLFEIEGQARRLARGFRRKSGVIERFAIQHSRSRIA